MAEENKTEPVFRVREGSYTVAGWENTTQNGKMLNLTLQRSYTDAEGNWQNTTSRKNGVNKKNSEKLFFIKNETHTQNTHRRRRVGRSILHRTRIPRKLHKSKKTHGAIL